MQMIDLYYIIAIVAYGIFIVKFLLSLLFGDTDTDVDIDGDAEADFDVSSLLSFKGLIHFCMGCFGWLAGKHYLTNHIGPYDGVIAIVLGIVFMIILYWVYKLCTKFQHVPSDPHKFADSSPETLFGIQGVVKYTDPDTGLAYCDFPVCGETTLLICEITETASVNSGQTVVIKGYNNETKHFQI